MIYFPSQHYFRKNFFFFLSSSYSLSSIGKPPSRVLIARNLNDNDWHHVTITRAGSLSEIRVDKHTKLLISPSAYESLSYKDFVYVAGYEYPGRAGRQSRFNGCIKLVQLDDRDLIKYYHQGSRRIEIKPEGEKLITNCKQYNHNPIGFQSSSASLTLNAPPALSFVEVNIKFALRTFSQSARVLTTCYKNKGNGKSGLKAILIEGNLAVIIWRHLNDYQEANILSGVIISDGSWHVIELKVTATEFSVIIDHRKIRQKTNFSIIAARDLKMIDQQSYRFGECRSQAGFLGCMDDIRLQNQTFHDVFDNRKSMVIKKKYIKPTCTLADHCFPNPCRNGASCRPIDHGNQVRCDCSGTEFYGQYCDRSLYKPSCGAYQQLGLNESSYCLVDPDGRGPLQAFTSFCRVLQDSNEVSTVVHHNMKEEFDGTNGDDKFLKFLKFTFHALKYELAPESVKEIIKNSERCRQKVVFKCRNTGLFNTPTGPPNVLWSNSEGAVRSYWGNIPSNISGCECSSAGGCFDQTKMCNCDALSDNWLEDRGYITDKSDLPVSRIDVTDGVKYGRTRIYIGPLECFGLKYDSSREYLTDRNIFKEQNLLSKVCVTFKMKENLINLANQNASGKLENERPLLKTTISTIEPTGQTNSENTISENINSISKEELTDDVTVYEVVLISIAAVATLTIIVKFIICHVFERLHGQVTLNHERRFDEPRSLFMTSDAGGVSSTSSLLKKQNGAKPPTNYWV